MVRPARRERPAPAGNGEAKVRSSGAREQEGVYKSRREGEVFGAYAVPVGTPPGGGAGVRRGAAVRDPTAARWRPADCRAPLRRRGARGWARRESRARLGARFAAVRSLVAWLGFTLFTLGLWGPTPTGAGLRSSASFSRREEVEDARGAQVQPGVPLRGAAAGGQMVDEVVDDDPIDREL